MVSFRRRSGMRSMPRRRFWVARVIVAENVTKATLAPSRAVERRQSLSAGEDRVRTPRRPLDRGSPATTSRARQAPTFRERPRFKGGHRMREFEPMSSRIATSSRL